MVKAESLMISAASGEKDNGKILLEPESYGRRILQTENVFLEKKLTTILQVLISR
jgi:hypothetical protein